MATGIKVTVQIAYIDDWLKIEIPVNIFSIKSARVRFKTDIQASVYLDRLEMKARSVNTNKLTLEKITSVLDKDYALSKAEFGEVFETLHDTIKEKVKDGDTALAIVAKQ